MKNFLLLISLFVTLSINAQDTEYKVNVITGKMDLVRSAKWLNKAISFNGKRAVTRPGLPAVNTGDSVLIDWLNNYFFPSTYPIVSITVNGGLSYEFMSAGPNLTVNLNWSVTRPIACNAIQSITVDGQAQTVNPINEGQSQTGTLNNRSLARNLNTTYTITASSTDKTSTSSQTVIWYWKRYWGNYTSLVPPTNPAFVISDADIISLNGAGIGAGSEFATARNKVYDGINGQGKYLVFAFPSTWGSPTFIVNGLISTAFTLVRNNLFINASGGSTNYQVWVSNTTLASAIAQFQIQ